MSALDGMFLTVLNMSITASYVALGVMVIRALLRRFPKVLSYALWAVVFFRLVCPFSFSAPVSLVGLVSPSAVHGVRAEYVPQDIGYMQTPTISSGITVVDKAVNKVLPPASAMNSVNPMQLWIMGLRLLWLMGVIVLLTYSVISYSKVKARLRTATLVGGNIYETDQIGTALVCGLIKPKIYLPLGVTKEDLPYIMEHERTHIRRLDYLIKPVAYLALILHWFNPLMWLSFALMTRDMEMSCDEAVLGKMGDKARTSYSGSLLSLAVRRSGVALASPLAFSESDVSSRIKNVLNYRRPRFWIAAIAVIAVTATLVAFAANPLDKFNIERVEANARLFESYKTDLVEIAASGIDQYYSVFMVKGVPPEYQITGYEAKEIKLLAGDEREFCVSVVSDYSTKGMYFLSANGDFRPDGNGYVCTGDYRQFRIKSLGDKKYQIVEIGTGGLTQGLAPVNPGQSSGSPLYSPADAATIDGLLTKIVSSPLTSSNPQDYINAHRDEYESILKGGQASLMYLLSQFESGNSLGLRGQIMVRLCQDFYGKRLRETDAALTPQQWYENLSIRMEIILPDYKLPPGDDPIKAAVYAAETARNSQPENGFTVVAPRIFGQYEEGELLKVFVTTFSARYRLYDDVLDLVGGSVVPGVITFRKDTFGNYQPHAYVQARDGSEFAPSIRQFCVVNGREIPGLADSMLSHYGNYQDLTQLQWGNLTKHLQAQGITDATLTNSYGEVIFSMSKPR